MYYKNVIFVFLLSYEKLNIGLIIVVFLWGYLIFRCNKKNKFVYVIVVLIYEKENWFVLL